MNYKYDTPLAQSISKAYASGEDDETINPLILSDRDRNPLGRIQPMDGVIFANIRGEREVEISQALLARNFYHFPVVNLNLNENNFTTMIQYHPDLPVNVAFPPQGRIVNSLTEFLSDTANMNILKCVESEKAIHLTYFFNGKNFQQFKNEERLIVQSFETEILTNYPEMKSKEVSSNTIAALSGGKHELIVTNLSPCDVMGHIENKDVIKRAIHAVDTQLNRIIRAALTSGYCSIITSDHGLVEKWLYKDGTIDTGHTSSPVPCLVISKLKKELSLGNGRSLIDIAPTIIHILGLKPPKEMEGLNLIQEGTLISDKVLLLILDGWGHNPDSYGNLLHEFGTPNMNKLKQKYPFTTLIASGTTLGMPKNTVGNSEIGHLHIGVGRRILSDRVRIFEAIETKVFLNNPNILKTTEFVKKNNSALHIIGIISFYSSHGSVKFLDSLIKLAKKQRVPKVYIHGILGRRGEKPESGAIYVNELEKKANKLGNVKVVSIIGRHWALDREGNWDRIKKTYNMLVKGEGKLIEEEST